MRKGTRGRDCTVRCGNRRGEMGTFKSSTRTALCAGLLTDTQSVDSEQAGLCVVLPFKTAGLHVMPLRVTTES